MSYPQKNSRFILNVEEIAGTEESKNHQNKLFDFLLSKGCRVHGNSQASMSLGIVMHPCQVSMHQHQAVPADFIFVDHSHGLILQCCAQCLRQKIINWSAGVGGVERGFQTFAVPCQRCLQRRSDYTIVWIGQGTCQVCHPCMQAGMQDLQEEQP